MRADRPIITNPTPSRPLLFLSNPLDGHWQALEDIFDINFANTLGSDGVWQQVGQVPDLDLHSDFALILTRRCVIGHQIGIGLLSQGLTGTGVHCVNRP